jgi:glycosyltransferase involved in cell wall biosynthesis
MAPTINISIIIRSKNEEKFIEFTLNSIRKQNLSHTFEIIVVDSGSQDRTLEIVRRYGARLIEIPEREFTYGRSLNLGAEEAKGDFIVNLSAHATPKSRQWLEKLIAPFDNKNVAGTYGRQISDGDVNPFEAYKNERFFGPERLEFNTKGGDSKRGTHFSNSNSAVRKEIWERFMFNEEVGWAEDLMWQEEVLNAGFSIVYTPKAVVAHTHPVDLRRAYRASRDCAFTEALVKGETKARRLLLVDLLVMWVFAMGVIPKNLWYVLRHGYFRHAGIVPAYVMATWLGWFLGKVDYRK